MEVEVKAMTECIIDIDSFEALKILCKTLDMNFVLYEDVEFFVRKNDDDENCVYTIENGKEILYDERGDLFVALRNVVVNIFPNVLFRSADYIYNR